MSAAAARVLAVEDDPIVRADLRVVLEDAGFEVSDARDGVEAVALARANAPDLIVLDLGLPRLGGVEATREILRERDVPIVALTGRSPALAAEALEAGAVTCLRKPFVVDELVRTIASTLDDRRLAAGRVESRRALGELLELIGYPADWALELEEAAFRNGKLWRRTG